MSYNVGDRILCVNDKNWKVILPNYPECGELYTIRGILEYTNGDIGFLLEEVVNPIIAPYIYETAFLTHRFTKFDPETFEDELLEEWLVGEVERMLDNGDTKKLEELLERI